MPKIILITEINAAIDICFDLSLSIDLHRVSTAHTNEKAIAGTTSGLIGLGETVTWQARHFGITQKLSSRISILQRPTHFRDEQVKGPFKYFIHDHFFEEKNGKIMMKDVFEFASPFGIGGRIFNRLILTSYLRNLLIGRNIVIKEYAESGRWKEFTNIRKTTVGIDE